MSDQATRLSGWCSPDCGPRAHRICQDRIDKGQLDGCSCPRHDDEKGA